MTPPAGRRAPARAGAARRGVRRAGRLVRRGAGAAPGAERHRAPAHGLVRRRCRRRRHLARRHDRAGRAAREGRTRRVGVARAAHARSRRSSATSTSRSRSPTSPTTCGRISTSPSATPSGCSRIVADILAASSSSSSSVEASIQLQRPRCTRHRPRVGRGADAPRRRPRDHHRHQRARGGTGLGRSDAAAAGRRQPALERDHVQPRRRHGLPRHHDGRHLELDPGARHRRRHQRGRPVAAVPALLQGGSRHDAPAPVSASRSRATSSAPTAATSGCTARPAWAPPSSSSCRRRPRRPPTPMPPRRDLSVTLDLASVMVMTALVVNVSGILFIVETLLRRDEGAGTRVGARRSSPAMLTTLAYIVWVQTPGAWWAIAVGNARVRRRHRMHVARMPPLQRPTDGAARRRSSPPRCSPRRSPCVVEGPDGGDWAGALWMFIPLLALRRRRRRGVPPRRARGVAHGVGARRRARLPGAVLRLADHGVLDLGSRERALPERLRHGAARASSP